ncbi:MAG: putative ABC exporter domain-containing protein [Nibricoccus sp.]
MIGALVYLQLTSLKNALLGRIRRLRNPRYLFAALVGAAYFYFFIFHRGGGASHHAPPNPALASQGPVLLELLGAFALFVAMALAWILPNSRAALAFTEAEVAHLFPAPIPRRTLVHFKLLKSQFSILLSILVLTLISNRWSFLAGGVWMHAIGWWLIFSIYNLHLVAASFARERLLHFGINALRRRLIICGTLILLGACTWFLLQRSIPLPKEDDMQDIVSMLDYVKTVLTTPPLGWALMPFRLVVRPFLATGMADFLSAVWPALLLLAAHYIWVLRSDVAFEEASVALSQKRAEAVSAMRAGKWSGLTPKKKRREPFELSPTGMPSVAFLWKGLITAGPFYYPRYWLSAGFAVIVAFIWFGRDPNYRLLAGGAFVVCTALGGYGLLFGPVLARRGLALMLERLDLAKSYPLRGWQIVLGEMMCPVTLLCVFEWIVLTLMAVAASFLQTNAELPRMVLLGGLVSAWLLIVPLSVMLFTLNYAGALLFPAWISTTVQTGGGLEKVGQRLIFMAGYLILLLVTLLPAVVFGAVPFFITKWLFQNLPLAIVFGSLTACAVLVGELAAALWWLGERFEKFDLSAELPR